MSRVSEQLLADYPDKPTTLPWKVGTDHDTLTIQVEPFDDSTNGGSTILAYQIELDDGKAGLYSVVLGLDELSLDTQVTVSNL